MVNRANVRALLVHLYDKMPEGSKGGASQLASFAASMDAELGGAATALGAGGSGASLRSGHTASDDTTSVEAAKADGASQPIAPVKVETSDEGSTSTSVGEPVAWRSLTAARSDQRRLALETVVASSKDETEPAATNEALEQAEGADLRGAEAKAHKGRSHGDEVGLAEDTAVAASSVAAESTAAAAQIAAAQIAAAQPANPTPQAEVAAAAKAGEKGVQPVTPQTASAKAVTAARQAARTSQGALATQESEASVDGSEVEASAVAARDRPAMRAGARTSREQLQGASQTANAAAAADAMTRSQAVGRVAGVEGARSARGSDDGETESSGSKSAVQELSWAGQHAPSVEGQASSGSAVNASGLHAAVQTPSGGAHAAGSGGDARATNAREDLRGLGGPVLHATEESAADRTVTATPSSLEVGVAQGGHGWLKVRAEMTEAGTVTAQLASSTAAGTQALHRDLPALSGFLEREQVPVSSLVVQASVQSGLSSGDDGGGRAGRQDASGQQGGQPEREAPREPGAVREEPEAASWEAPSIGGGWLSVRA